MRKIIAAISIFILCGISFLYGILVMQKKIFPYHLLAKVYEKTLLPSVTLEDYAFTDPIIESELIYSPIEDINDIFKYNKRIFIDYNKLYTAYDSLVIINDTLLILNEKDSIIKLTFLLDSIEYNTYSYIRLNNSEKCAFIIPGSGHNQSSGIYYKDPMNYHKEINEILGDNFDTYIFIKPNEDVLAWHNGKNKINTNFYVNWHITNGSSYSASYLIFSLAFSKYLNEKYDNVYNFGLSQGGAATLVNSIYSKPLKSVIASGFSISFDTIIGSGHDQFIIPRLREKILNKDSIYNILNKLDTKFLFTYGKNEDGTYGMEANDSISFSFINSIENCEVEIHLGEHLFTIEEIKEFINE